MVTLEEIVNELDSLTPENLAELARFVDYLKWQQGTARAQAPGQLWTFDLVEHFRRAMVTADHDRPAWRSRLAKQPVMAIRAWHCGSIPPSRVHPSSSTRCRYQTRSATCACCFATGIRDGSQLAEGNVVAFRIFVNDWKIWSDTQHARQWKNLRGGHACTHRGRGPHPVCDRRAGQPPVGLGSLGSATARGRA